MSEEKTFSLEKATNFIELIAFIEKVESLLITYDVQKKMDSNKLRVIQDIHEKLVNRLADDIIIFFQELA